MSKISHRTANKKLNRAKRWRRQSWRSPRYFVSLLVVIILVAFGGYALTHYSHASPSSTGVTVSGNQFLLNGKPFTPHGFNSIAMLHSSWCANRANTSAYNDFGATEIQNAITKWNANTLRFQVSQPVLAGPHGAAYAQQINKGIALALQAGLVVDVSMQDEILACGQAEPFPSGSLSGDTDSNTKAAWTTLLNNTNLKNSPNVMFELYNEPKNSPSSSNSTSPTAWTWRDWLNGGRQISDPGGSKHGLEWQPYTPIGHQHLVDYLRTTLGVNNVLIADGAENAETLAGVPILHDPGGNNQIAYGIHPYAYASGTPSSWNARWGTLAATHPVIDSEWNCFVNNPTPAQTEAFLNYMRTTVHVGILGHALDAGGLVTGVDLTPNTCGNLFQTYYTNYFAPPPPHIKRRPTKPGNLRTVLATTSSLTVSWKPSVGEAQVMMYRVRVNGKLVATITNITTYTASGLQPGTSYTFEVRATDGVGDFSNPAMLTATTLVVKPVVPTPTSPGSVIPITITPPDGQPTPISSGETPQLGGTVTLSTPAASVTTVKVDGTTISHSGTVDTTYLSNGTHAFTLVTKQLNGTIDTANRVLDIENNLSLWQEMRDTLFAALVSHPVLMNGSFWTSLGVAIVIVGFVVYRFRLHRPLYAMIMRKR